MIWIYPGVTANWKSPIEVPAGRIEVNHTSGVLMIWADDRSGDFLHAFAPGDWGRVERTKGTRTG